MSDSIQRYQSLLEEEEHHTFNQFSRKDALELGLEIIQQAKNYPAPITVEITINGLSVFRYFMEGAVRDSDLWLARKRNSVDLMAMSSLRFLYWLEINNKTLEGRKLDPVDYAAGGGGYPIRIKGMDVVGSICVSGLPNHEDDHQLIIDAMNVLYQ